MTSLHEFAGSEKDLELASLRGELRELYGEIEGLRRGRAELTEKVASGSNRFSEEIKVTSGAREGCVKST